MSLLRAVISVTVFALFVLAIPMITAGGPSPHQSPYAGQEYRTVKALSPQDVLAVGNGEEMGLARAAELNRYPDPKRVLDLADDLELSTEQRVQAGQTFFARNQEAV